MKYDMKNIQSIMNDVIDEVTKNRQEVVIAEPEPPKPEVQQTVDELSKLWDEQTKQKEESPTAKALSENKPFMKEEEIIDFYLRKIVTEPYMSFALQFCFDVPSIEGLELGKRLEKRRVPGHNSLKYALEQEVVFFSRLVSTLKFKKAKQDVIDDAEGMLHNRLTSLSSIIAEEERKEFLEQEAELRKSMKKGRR